MSRDLPWGRIAYEFSGYLAAVLVAVTATVATVLLWTAQKNAVNWGSFYAFVRHLGDMYRFGIMVTLPAALPGFLLTLFVAHRVGWAGWLPFAAAGTLNAILALTLFGIYIHQDVFEQEVVLPCLPGGFAGGVAYWAVVRKSLRDRAASP